MYVANVFDSDLTYIVGWSMILGYPASAAFYLASFSDWFYRFIYPAFSIPEAIPYWVGGFVVLALLVGINLKGTEETGAFQIAVTGLKVALIILFLYGGLQSFDASIVVESLQQNTQTFADFRDIGLTSALVFITFFGFEAIATNAEEIKKPGDTVPRAIFISMGLVTVIYTLVVLVIVIAVNDPKFLDFLTNNVELGGLTAKEYIANHGEVSMAYAAKYFLEVFGNAGFYVIIVGALFSMISAANATILAGSRVKLAMARRDHLPSQFEDLHDTFNTPHKAVLLTGGLILFYIAVFSVVFGSHPGSGTYHPPFGLHLGIEHLAHFADFMLLGGLIVVNLAVVQSRRKFPDIDRGFEVPFVPVVPVIAVLANLVLFLNVSPVSFAIGVVAEIVGVAFWFTVLSGKPAEHAEEETPTLVAEHHPSESEYTLLVSIANPEHVPQLMRTAVDIAKDRDGDILVMSAVELPAQTPLSEGGQYLEDEREIVDEAMEFAREEDVPVSGTVRIGHDVSEAITNTVDQYECDAALLGWSGTSRRRDIVLGSTVDEVIRDAACDVLVEKTGEVEQEIASILLPTAGGPHAEFAAEVSSAIAHSEGATVRVVHVVDPDASETERRDAQDRIDDTVAALSDVEYETELLEGEDVVDTIVTETAETDLTLVGATREGILQQLVLGAVPEAVGKRAKGAVIMTKRNLGITSRLRQWLRWE
ncbi:amino acid permease [Halospeciosus flavus]